MSDTTITNNKSVVLSLRLSGKRGYLNRLTISFLHWSSFVAFILLPVIILCSSPTLLTAQSTRPSVEEHDGSHSERETEWRAAERSRLHNEALQHWLNGELNQAISCQTQQLEIESQLFGAASVRLAPRYDTLYRLHLEQGDFVLAEQFLEQACQSMLLNAAPGDWQSVDVARKRAAFKTFQALSEKQRQVLFGYSREQHQHLKSLEFATALTAAENLACLLSEYLGEQHPDWVDAVAGIEAINMAQGKLDNTTSQLAKLYATLEQVEHPNHPNFGKLQWLLGTLATFQNDTEAAQRYYRAAIEQYEKASYTHDVSYVRSLSQYASELYATGQFEQALPMYRKAYHLWANELAIDDEQETIVSRDLCLVLQRQARQAVASFQLDLAESLLQEAQRVAKLTWGNDDYRTQDITDELTMVVQARNWSDDERAVLNLLASTQASLAEQINKKNFAEAIQLANHCCELAAEVHGSDSKATVKIERDRMLLRMRHGRFSNMGIEQFIKELLDFVARHELTIGRNHPLHAELCFLASEFIFGKSSRAIELARVAQLSYRESLSVAANEYLVASTHLGALLAEAGEAECEDLLSETIDRWESGPSRGCYRHCMALLWLGKHYYETGYNYEARIQLAKAVRMMRVNEVVPHFEHADALNFLANTYFDEEDYHQSLIYYQEAIALYRKSSQNSPASAFRLPQWLLYNTAVNQYHLGNFIEAEDLLNELLSQFPTTTLSSADAFRSGCYSLTRVLLKIGKLELAEQSLQRASQSVRIHFPHEPLITLEMLLENAEFYASQQKTQAADDLLQQAFVVLRDKTDFASLEPTLSSTYFRLADRLVRDSEEIGRWQLSAEVRQNIAPHVKSHFEAGWDWIVRLEQRQLVEVQKIAAATPEQQQLIGELRARTSHLAHAAETDFRTVQPSDPKRMAQAYDTTIDVLGEQNLLAANYRHAIARYFERDQQFQTALLSEQYAASTFLSLFGADHPESARACVQFARIGRKIGAYQLSQQMLELALPTLTSIQGDQSRDTLSATLELAELLVDVKNFSAALPLVRNAERDFAVAWGENSIDYGEALRVLGLVFQGMNESAVAAEYLRKSHEILTAQLDPSDSRLLRSASRSAIAQAQESTSFADSAAAIEAVLQQYRDYEQTHLIDYVALLVDYSDVLMQHDRHAQALEVLELAFASVVELDGMGDDVQRAAIGQRLGIAHRQLGQLQEAATKLEFAAVIQRNIFGEQSSALCETLFQQAIVSHLMANHQLAADQVLASLQIEQELLGNIGFLLSDESLRSLLAQPENRLSLLLRQLLANGTDHRENVEQAFYWTLQRKGLSLDVACRLRSLRRSRLYDSNIVRLAGRVGLLNQQMADLALLSTDKRTPEEIRQQQADLARDIATTNSELSLALKGEDTRLFGFADNLDSVRKQIPLDTTLIEFVRVEDFSNHSTDTANIDRYIGFLLSANAEQPLVMCDLGPALEIDQLIEELRTETRDFSSLLSISTEESLEAKYREIAHRLYEKLLGPFGEACLQCKTLVIGPDSNISLVPFSALVGPQQRYLVEDLNICYVSSSRDLLRKPTQVGKGTTIIANPNYDADLQSRQQAIDQIAQQTDLPSMLVMRSEGEMQTRALRWRRLPGAEQEANAVAEILGATPFGPVKKYLGTEAVEEVLKASQSPRIVHLATHGFYVPLVQTTQPEAEQTRSINFVSGLAKLRTDNNPLLRSGIVFAGANRVAQPQSGSQMGDDGWLTAQEIAGMDFRNTELLVLSACESGLGDATNGQGLQGICRAFSSAGAHAVLTSLFEVPDVETRDLMRAFYENFVATERRVAAINQAQRQQIDTRRKQYNAAHPFFWASFIMISNAEH